MRRSLDFIVVLKAFALEATFHPVAEACSWRVYALSPVLACLAAAGKSKLPPRRSLRQPERAGAKLPTWLQPVCEGDAFTLMEENLKHLSRQHATRRWTHGGFANDSADFRRALFLRRATDGHSRCRGSFH